MSEIYKLRVRIRPNVKLRKLLAVHVIKSDSSWPAIGQFFIRGSMEKYKDQWLCGELLTSFVACKGNTGPRKMPKFKLVFPSVEDLRCSLEGYRAGAPYPTKRPSQKSRCWQTSCTGRSLPIRSHPRRPAHKVLSPVFPVCEQPEVPVVPADQRKPEQPGQEADDQVDQMGVLFLPKFVLGEKHLHVKLCDQEGGFLAPMKVLPTPYVKGRMWNAPHAEVPDLYGNGRLPE